MNKTNLTKDPKMKEYNVKVCCVLWEFTDSNGNADIKMIKEHAHASGSLYTTRLYDSLKYSDDRKRIQRLPAYHIYINSAYMNTFYPDTDPLEHINECIEICNKRNEIKKKAKQEWSKVYSSVINWLPTFKPTSKELTAKPTLSISN
jgi:hypothetical protein